MNEAGEAPMDEEIREAALWQMEQDKIHDMGLVEEELKHKITHGGLGVTLGVVALLVIYQANPTQNNWTILAISGLLGAGCNYFLPTLELRSQLKKGYQLKRQDIEKGKVVDGALRVEP